MSTIIGQAAEDFAASYLASIGFEILARNWKTATCEVDIIARRNKVVHFVEVKYRKNDFAGKGIEYVTPAKAKQLKFAALTWITEQNYQDDYQIDVIGITGELKLSNLELVLNAVED